MNKIKIAFLDLRRYTDRRTVEEILGLECNCLRIACGEGALERLRTFRPCGLFLDFDFPDHQGLAMVGEVRQQFPSLPQVMLTEEHSEALAVWALRARLWNYFVKPVERDSLLATVRTLYRIELMRDNKSERTPVTPAHEMPAPPHPRPEYNEKAVFQPAIDYVHREVTGRVVQKDAARYCGMSTFQFSRAFKRTYGITFQDYVMNYRLEQASRLLQNQHASVTEVGWAVGFRDASYFSRTFRRRYNCTPSGYRERWADKTKGTAAPSLQ